MDLIFRWLIGTFALYATVWILSLFGLAKPESDSPMAWLAAGAIMGLINAFIRPVARLLTWPLNCMTLGLVGVLVNGLLFWLVAAFSAAAGVQVFEVGLLGAILGALILGAINGAAAMVLLPSKDKR